MRPRRNKQTANTTGAGAINGTGTAVLDDGSARSPLVLCRMVAAR
jgi:hypothetical protein